MNKPRARSWEWARGTWDGARGTGHGARGTGHGARGTGHGARGTGHGARGTGHGARGTGYLEFVGGSPAIGREVLEEGDEPEETGVPVAQQQHQTHQVADAHEFASDVEELEPNGANYDLFQMVQRCVKWMPSYLPRVSMVHVTRSFLGLSPEITSRLVVLKVVRLYMKSRI